MFHWMNATDSIRSNNIATNSQSKRSITSALIFSLHTLFGFFIGQNILKHLFTDWWMNRRFYEADNIQWSKNGTDTALNTFGIGLC